MCLIAVAYKAHPEIRLLVLANRDEFHDRATDTCRWWGEEGQVLSGRDRVAGGTWLAINRQGRFAAVTNYRQPQAAAGTRSRGHLPLDYLASRQSASEYCQSGSARFNQYAGVNLLAFDGQTLAWLSNRGGGTQEPEAGVHALSNRHLNSDWPKTRKIRSAVADLLVSVPRFEDCLEVLADRHQGKDADLPDTGVGLDLERFLSPAFIVSDNYGTRSSTVLMIRESGATRLTEVSFDRSGNPCNRMDFEFQLAVTGPRSEF